MLGKNTNSCHGEMSTNVSNMLIYYKTILPCCHLHIRVGSYGIQRVVGREPSASCLRIPVFFCIFILFDWSNVNFGLVTYLLFPDVLVAICGDNFTSSDLPRNTEPILKSVKLSNLFPRILATLLQPLGGPARPIQV